MFVNLTPHEINIVRPGGNAAACGHTHWEFFPEGVQVPDIVWDCSLGQCVVGVQPFRLNIQPSGKVARLASEEVMVGSLYAGWGWNEDIPIYRTTFGEVVVASPDGSVEAFPAPEGGVVYITSALVAERLKRADVVSPHTVRDGEGKIVGCDGFVSFFDPSCPVCGAAEFTDKTLPGHCDVCHAWVRVYTKGSRGW